MVLQPARNGGLDCVGDAIESRPCSQVACPGELGNMNNILKVKEDIPEPSSHALRV